MKYFTPDYFRALIEALNKDAQFTRDARDMDLSILNVCSDRNQAFLIRIHKGLASTEQVSVDYPAEFKISGTYSNLCETVKNGNLDSAVMNGKIRIDGSMFRLISMRSKLERMEQIGRQLPKEF